MANDTWTPPAGPAAGALNRAEMITQRTDNINVLGLVVNGDASASGQRHRHKQGTLAARPAASAPGGDFYFATDIGALFYDDGSSWRNMSGRGLYDDFTRADSSTLGFADSGHAWTEPLGGGADIEILSNALHATALNSGSAFAIVDTGGQIRNVRMIAHFVLHATAGSSNVGIMLKYAGPSGFSDRLYLQIYGSANQLRIVRGATVVATTPYAVTGGASVVMEADLMGGNCYTKIMSGTSLQVMAAFRDSTQIGVETITQCGIFFGSAGAGSDTCLSFGASFNG